jgi:hypothetical protein
LEAIKKGQVALPFIIFIVTKTYEKVAPATVTLPK